MTDVFHDAVHGAVATKADLEELRAENRVFAANTMAEFTAVRAEFGIIRSEMREQRSELKLWMVGTVVAAVGALGTLMTFLLRARGVG